MSFIFAILFIGLAVYLLFRLLAGKGSAASVDKATQQQTVHFPDHAVPIITAVFLGYQVIVYDMLFAGSPPVFGLAVFNTLCILSLAYLLRDKIKANRLLLLPIAGSILISFASVLRANGFVQGVNFFALVLINSFLLLVYSMDRVKSHGLWIASQILAFPIRWLLQIFKFFDASSVAHEKVALHLHKALKTLLITAVTLIVFTVLLMNADPIFAQKVSNIIEQSFGRVVTGIFFAVLTASVISLRRTDKEEVTEPVRFLALHDILMPMIALVLLFGFFISIQVEYLFAEKHDLTAFGLTYSEYVRKGFVELLFTTFLGGLFIYIAAVKVRFSQMTAKLVWLQAAASMVVLELGFILASALKRDLLYVDVYGLTRVRIVGGVFVAWLALVLIALLCFICLKKLKEKQLLYAITGFSAVVVILLNTLNIDALVITQQPAHHEYTDHFYIANLSEDAADYWETNITAIEKDLDGLLVKEELSEIERSQLAGLKLSLITLQERRKKLYLQYTSESDLNEYAKKHDLYIRDTETNELYDAYQEKRQWQQYNYASHQAFQQMESNKALYFDKLDALVERVRIYQDEKNISLLNEERRLLYDFSYPFIGISLEYYPERDYRPEPTPRATPTGTFSPSPSPVGHMTNYTLANMIQDPCLLKPGAAVELRVWAEKVDARDYFISNSAQTSAVKRVTLAENIDIQAFDAGVPGYKTVTLKTSIACDPPVIVFAR